MIFVTSVQVAMGRFYREPPPPRLGELRVRRSVTERGAKLFIVD